MRTSQKEILFPQSRVSPGWNAFSEAGLPSWSLDVTCSELQKPLSALWINIVVTNMWHTVITCGACSENYHPSFLAGYFVLLSLLLANSSLISRFSGSHWEPFCNREDLLCFLGQKKIKFWLKISAYEGTNMAGYIPMGMYHWFAETLTASDLLDFTQEKSNDWLLRKCFDT